jgi:hypothetical protein
MITKVWVTVRVTVRVAVTVTVTVRFSVRVSVRVRPLKEISCKIQVVRPNPNPEEFQRKYALTVITRIFFKVNASRTGKLSLKEVRNSTLMTAFMHVSTSEELGLGLGFMMGLGLGFVIGLELGLGLKL